METLLQHPLSNNFGFIMNNYSDFDTVNTVLQQIALEKNWSTQDVDGDIDILTQNRIFHVSDLRILSQESWTQIQLLPLVKDLLKLAIGTNNEVKAENESNEKNKKNDEKHKKGKKDKKKNNKKEKKKDKKKKEKEEKKGKGFVSPSPLGTPVVPTILRPPSPGMNAYNNNDTTDDEDYNHNGISHDHLTIHNTILNGNTSCGSSAEDDYDDEEEILSPSGTVRRKSVSFSNETSIGVAASEKKKDKDDSKKKNKDKKGKKKSEKGK